LTFIPAPSTPCRPRTRQNRLPVRSRVDEIYIFHVRDGKLVSGFGVEDNLTRLRQLGIELRAT